MYAAVRRIEGVTDPSEVRRQVEEGFVPIISEMPGFVAYYLLDAGEGVMVCKKWWTGAEEAVMAFEGSGGQSEGRYVHANGIDI